MLGVVLVALVSAIRVQAYVPAVPTNNTGAVNQTDMSRFTMKWAPGGIYSNTVSYQLASANSSGYDIGALVYFSENGLTDQNTTTPWIALVNCDSNATTPSVDDDIFTLARDRGATAALLYSETAEACLINPEYTDPDIFEQILDVFTTQNKNTTQMILSQFRGLKNASYSSFNATLLSAGVHVIMSSIQSINITSPFIVATLRAANSTAGLNATDNGDGSSGDVSSRNNPNTGLAMIILYAITGCVSGLFIIVIVSGAIRAIRHPERYGPRAAITDDQGIPTPRQSRTGGIGRAILDTFPIIKFGQNTLEAPPDVKRGGLENGILLDGNVEMASRSPSEEKAERIPNADERVTPGVESSSGDDAQHASSYKSSNGGTLEADTVLDPSRDLNPSAIGHETCPICIVDFESGDDLRVLPCDGKHKFHQACVDPWLLELSSSCPLCREDFHALASLIGRNDSPEPEGADTLRNGSLSPEPSSPASSRLVRYLRFARRRNQTSRGASSSATDGRLETSSADP